MNAVWFLQPDGIIVADDVIADDYLSSLPALNEMAYLRAFLARRDPQVNQRYSWIGDIFKIPFFVQNFRQAYSYATVSDNHGQTIIWEARRAAHDIPRQKLEMIAGMTRKDMIMHESQMRIMPLADIMAEISAAGQSIG